MCLGVALGVQVCVCVCVCVCVSVSVKAYDVSWGSTWGPGSSLDP